MKEALILACSRAKLKPGEYFWASDGKAPAVWVYDGPWWRTLRKYNPRVHVFALSGKFGLIPAHTLIPHYDVKMQNVPSAQWVGNHLLPNAPLLSGFDTVWTCVPQRAGGYATAVEILESYLNTCFRDVIEVLPPSDENLLAHAPYFARTRTMSLFCHARERYDPMPSGRDVEDWQDLMSQGVILGW